MKGVKNIPTRFALVKRAEKILSDIDKYFEEADSFGLSTKEADPDGLMMNMRKGLVAMLEREGRLGIVL
jgi:ABC-type enterochelin transport system substrate-binding protein